MATISVRIDLEPEGRIGPGKIRLLEKIEELGSISAAGRAMGMSYRRAWLLIDELNGFFGKAVVATRLGGASGGGAALTPWGSELVRNYRAIEEKAQEAGRSQLTAIQAAVGRRKD